tara:strand:- start:1149 stop:1646 length:498 start_codon:yes stop_codon:yes gene_type:complete
MTLNSSLNGQQLKPENTTSSGSPSPLSQNLEKTGQKCTKCGKSEPEAKWTSRANSWGKRYKRPVCNSCWNEQAKSRGTAVNQKFGPGKPQDLIRKNRPPVGTPCKKCDIPMTHGQQADSVNFDHDPVTHKFRGWICKKCNTSIGGLGDSIQGLEQALKYLNETTN